MLCGDWGCCCSLAPSCGAEQGNLLHFAQLCQQPFHAVFELRQTGQRFWRLQLSGIVQPALQHWGGRRTRDEHMVTNDVFLITHKDKTVPQAKPGMMRSKSQQQWPLGCCIILCIIKSKCVYVQFNSVEWHLTKRGPVLDPAYSLYTNPQWKTSVL